MGINFDEYNPIIIIGAGRSGTKLLRRIIDQSQNTVSFPHEINYIWRYGNAKYPTDELKPKHARKEVTDYIRNRFSKLSSNKRIIEKTCANSLRVDFVRNIFPEAKFVHLIRDGRAVAESARRQWKSTPNIIYLLEKFRWVPIQDMPYYFSRYVKYQMNRLYSDESFEGSWGPRFEGIDKIIKEKSLIETCGIQWRECVSSARKAFEKMPADKGATIYYEDLVEGPVENTKALFDFLNLDYTNNVSRFIKEEVTTENINKWKIRLTDVDLKKLYPNIKNELSIHNFI